MTPGEFIDKWTRLNRTERQAAQEHFIDLCRVLGEPTPNEGADPDAYSFEKGVSKTDGRAGSRAGGAGDLLGAQDQGDED